MNSYTNREWELMSIERHYNSMYVVLSQMHNLLRSNIFNDCYLEHDVDEMVVALNKLRAAVEYQDEEERKALLENRKPSYMDDEYYMGADYE